MKWLLLLFLLLPFSAQATIELTSATNASAFEVGSIPKIFGGTSGTCTTGTDTCDSCATATDFSSACNRLKVSSTTEVAVFFKITSEFSGSGKALIFAPDGTTAITPITGSSTSVAKDEDAKIIVKWADLCTHFTTGADGGCSSNGFGSFKIGIDGDANGVLADSESGSVTFQIHSASDSTASPCGTEGKEGACGINASPGDAKVIIDAVDTLGSFPSATSIKFTALRVFFGTTFPKNPQGELGETYANLAVSTDSVGFFFDNNKITGLANDTLYFFRPASVDQAGNVGFFVDDSVIVAACDVSTVDQINAEKDIGCPYAATPSEVFGLLEDDINCFIATAAYGSAWHQKVIDLRLFRDLYLKTSTYGRKFVKFYYTYGPAAAQMISDNPTARAIVRIALTPIWAVAWVMLKIGPMLTLIAFCLLTLFAFLFLRTSRTLFSKLTPSQKR